MMFVISKIDWDDFLLDLFYNKWILWMDLLSYFESLCIFRMYSNIFFEDVNYREVLVFVDVLKNVVVVVVYIKLYDGRKFIINFLMGKVKFVLMYGYIIFCLELCVVVFVIEIVENI